MAGRIQGITVEIGGNTTKPQRKIVGGAGKAVCYSTSGDCREERDISSQSPNPIHPSLTTYFIFIAALFLIPMSAEVPS